MGTQGEAADSEAGVSKSLVLSTDGLDVSECPFPSLQK
jgi:hypothetical protein